MTEQFWTFVHTSWGTHISHVGSWFLSISSREFDLHLAPEQETPSWAIGRHFLRYAYSTPAGVAYRLTYGISKE